MATDTRTLGGFGNAYEVINPLVTQIKDGVTVPLTQLLQAVYDIFEACSIPEQTMRWTGDSGVPEVTGTLTPEKRQSVWTLQEKQWGPSDPGIHPIMQKIAIPCFIGKRDIQGMNMTDLCTWLATLLVSQNAQQGSHPEFAQLPDFDLRNLRTLYRGIEGMRVTGRNYKKPFMGEKIGRTFVKRNGVNPTGTNSGPKVSAEDAIF